MYSPSQKEAKCPVCQESITTTHRMQTLDRQMVLHLGNKHNMSRAGMLDKRLIANEKAGQNKSSVESKRLASFLLYYKAACVSFPELPPLDSLPKGSDYACFQLKDGRTVAIGVFAVHVYQP